MKNTSLRFITLLFAMFFLPAVLIAQKKESLAIFAFNGGNASDGETIASSLSRQATLRNAFNKTTLVTRGTIAAMNFEQRFQRNGLTDADTIFELGKALNASHVIAGFITRLGNNNLVLVSIMDVESLQQIAGDYRTYRSIEEIDKLIPDIAQKLAAAVTRNTSGLPGLSVPPFSILSGVNQNDANNAMVLAQILACELANGDKFAVLPRTDNLEKVMEEHRRQRSGVTNQERVKLLGIGRNAQYVLSGSVQKLGTLNKFAAEILDIVDGSIIDGYDENYSDLSQGFVLIPKLAGQLMWGMSLAEIKTAVAGNYTITLTKDVQIKTSIDFIGFENKKITIQGDSWGRNITFPGNSSFSIPNNVVIILSNITLKGNSEVARGSVIKVNKGGRLEMQNGATITDNGAIGGGGGVVIDGGTFIMNGGTISDNTASGWSGGIGGGVCVDGGIFIMNDGTIARNIATSPNGGWGGGVAVLDGTFTMNGGTITENTAYTVGGGVWIIGGSFTMNNGTISKNAANNNVPESAMGNSKTIGVGGGVGIEGNSTFTMNGGRISDNNAKNFGGGVSVFGPNSKFIKKGGIITSSNVITSVGWGNVVGGPTCIRSSEAGESVNLDSSIKGKRGGWVDWP